MQSPRFVVIDAETSFATTTQSSVNHAVQSLVFETSIIEMNAQHVEKVLGYVLNV
ncbi:MAG: hypothetical protein ACXADC_06530 [Candidatus Thorarchaeota archaeon]